MGNTPAISKKASPAPTTGSDINSRLRSMGLGTIPARKSNDAAYTAAYTLAYKKLFANAWKIDGKAACAQAMNEMRALNQPAKAAAAPAIEDKIETKKIPGSVSAPIKNGEMYGVTVETAEFGASFAFDSERKAQMFSTVAERQRIAGTLTRASANVLAGGINRNLGAAPTPTAPACDEPPVVQPESVAKRTWSFEVKDLLWLSPDYDAYRLSKFVAEKSVDGGRAIGRAAVKAKDAVVEEGRAAGRAVVKAKDTLVEEGRVAKEFVFEKAGEAKDVVVDNAHKAKDAIADTTHKAYEGAKSLWNRKLFTITIE